MTSVQVRGHDIEVAIHGDGGLPIVLLAGGGASTKWYFPGLVESLSNSHRVVVFDRLGTGTAPVPTSGASLKDASSDLVVVLDALGFDQVVLVGHSLGAALGALFIVDHADRVAGALLLDPTTINNPRLAATTARAAIMLARLTRLPLVGSVLSKVLLRVGRPSSMSAAAQESFDKTMVGDWVGDAARAARSLPDDARALGDRRPSHVVPCVVVTADRKPTARPRLAHEELADRLGAQIEVWAGTTHSVHLEKPQEIIERLRDLLEVVEARATDSGG